MAATFHPELSEDPRVHQVFLDLVGGTLVDQTRGLFSGTPSLSEELIRDRRKDFEE